MLLAHVRGEERHRERYDSALRLAESPEPTSSNSLHAHPASRASVSN
jgi:hypothetical protein